MKPDIDRQSFLHLLDRTAAVIALAFCDKELSETNVKKADKTVVRFIKCQPR